MRHTEYPGNNCHEEDKTQLYMFLLITKHEERRTCNHQKKSMRYVGILVPLPNLDDFKQFHRLHQHHHKPKAAIAGSGVGAPGSQYASNQERNELSMNRIRAECTYEDFKRGALYFGGLLGPPAPADLSMRLPSLLYDTCVWTPNILVYQYNLE